MLVRQNWIFDEASALGRKRTFKWYPRPLARSIRVPSARESGARYEAGLDAGGAASAGVGGVAGAGIEFIGAASAGIMVIAYSVG